MPNTERRSGTDQASGGAARGAEDDIDGAEAAVSFSLLGTFDPTPLDDAERTLTLQVRGRRFMQLVTGSRGSHRCIPQCILVMCHCCSG
mgnify:CR=1 FL=1